MAKTKTVKDEKFTDIDFPLFPALEALDNKDYGFYDRLTDEQKKKFTAFMMVQWISNVKSNSKLQEYYLLATNDFINKHLFNEVVQKHPKLLWLLLCTVSPKMGKQFHQWIPQIKDRVTKLKDKPKKDEVMEYYKKIYPGIDNELLSEVTNQFMNEYSRKVYLANEFPTLKYDEIEVLNAVITDDEIKRYEEERGN